MSYEESYIFHPTLGRQDTFHGYKCGYCNHENSGRVVGYYPSNSAEKTKWLLCVNCGQGSVLTPRGILYPSSKFGSNVEGLPKIVERVYDEARNCYSIGAYTSCELICRKILMNVSVEKGAEENKTFVHYLDFLKDKGYITNAMKDWVAIIRKNGGQSTHHIEEPEKDRAESTLTLTEQLLKIIYEVIAKAEKYTKTEENHNSLSGS